MGVDFAKSANGLSVAHGDYIKLNEAYSQKDGLFKTTNLPKDAEIKITGHTTKKGETYATGVYNNSNVELKIRSVEVRYGDQYVKRYETNPEVKQAVDQRVITQQTTFKSLSALPYTFKKKSADLGEDVYTEGLIQTPIRVAKAMQFLTHGYGLDPLEILKSALFSENHQQMIVVKDIEVYSMCEHHMLPFFGKAHVAYIPNGKIVGLSKIPRVVDAFARRMQVQERLTDQIKNCIQEALDPLGVAVVIEAQHMCMQMRGIQKQNSFTTTSSFTGQFEKDKTRKEFISLISNKLS